MHYGIGPCTIVKTNHCDVKPPAGLCPSWPSVTSLPLTPHGLRRLCSQLYSVRHRCCSLHVVVVVTHRLNIGPSLLFACFSFLSYISLFLILNADTGFDIINLYKRASTIAKVNCAELMHFTTRICVISFSCHILDSKLYLCRPKTTFSMCLCSELFLCC